MSRYVSIIKCGYCDEQCGRWHPDTWNDPGYSEGPGENYVDEDGGWYCSQGCLDQHKK